MTFLYSNHSSECIESARFKFEFPPGFFPRLEKLAWGPKSAPRFPGTSPVRKGIIPRPPGWEFIPPIPDFSIGHFPRHFPRQGMSEGNSLGVSPGRGKFEGNSPVASYTVCTLKRSKLGEDTIEALQVLKFSTKQQRVSFMDHELAKAEDYALEGPLTEYALEELMATGQTEVLHDLLENTNTSSLFWSYPALDV